MEKLVLFERFPLILLLLAISSSHMAIVVCGIHSCVGELLQLSVSLEKIDIVQIVEEALLVDMCQALYFMIMLRERSTSYLYQQLAL